MGDAGLHDEDMGSQVNQDAFTVLVTGFSAFREQYPVNPSWEIARSLPLHLPPLRAKNPNARSGYDGLTMTTSTTDFPAVRILVHPEPIHVNYKAVRELVPKFWEDEYSGHRIDAAIHIGMASARPVYQLERLAHRTGYKSADVDGELLEDEGEGKHDENWIWNGLPDSLESDLDIPNVYLRWKELCSPDMDVRISEDPGRYLCDFIYYSSLSTLLKKNRPGKVCFFHVPADASDKAVERGREIAINLIRSIAESEIADRKRAAK